MERLESSVTLSQEPKVPNAKTGEKTPRKSTNYGQITFSPALSAEEFAKELKSSSQDEAVLFSETGVPTEKLTLPVRQTVKAPSGKFIDFYSALISIVDIMGNFTGVNIIGEEMVFKDKESVESYLCEDERSFGLYHCSVCHLWKFVDKAQLIEFCKGKDPSQPILIDAKNNSSRIHIVVPMSLIQQCYGI